jgi:hypothetical protein
LRHKRRVVHHGVGELRHHGHVGLILWRRAHLRPSARQNRPARARIHLGRVADWA